MIDPRDIEILADAEHRSWSGWTEWMLSEMSKEFDGDCDIESLPCVIRWRRQIATDYKDLSEREKESDRRVVRQKLPVYRPDQHK